MAMPFVSFLLFCQMLGAFTGAVMSLWSEFSYVRALRDGKVDTAERAHLRIIAKGLRFGMTLLLVASVALVVSAYVFRAAEQPALTAGYWIFVTFALLIIALSWALSKRLISFALGSSAILTAWWLLAYLMAGRLPFSYGSTVALYVVLAAVMYGFLHLIRFFALR